MRAVIALGLALTSGCGLAIFKGDDESDVDANGSGDGDGGGSNNGYCSDPAKLVFTLEDDNRLSKFDPATGTFQTVGYVDCPGSSQFFQPFSMGVDRNAIAWILYRDRVDTAKQPELFRVDTETLQCDTTTWTPQGGVKLFSMGFATDMEGSVDDTLFISGGTTVSGTSSTLETLSTTTFVASNVGTMSGWAELSGNAKGELWAYLPLGSTQSFQLINKATGATSTTFNLPALTGMPNAWAFAWWGGDFWVFYHRQSDPATLIYQFDGSTGAFKTVTDTNSVGIPRTIVGAGVSTCAPIILL